MTILAFPPVVPDNTYRIRSADRADPDLYLEWEDNNEVDRREECYLQYRTVAGNA